MKLEDLERLAREATPGDESERTLHLAMSPSMDAFYVAMSPDVCLRLLAVVREAQAVVGHKWNYHDDFPDLDPLHRALMALGAATGGVVARSVEDEP